MSLENAKMLVVDDDKLNRFNLSSALEKLGHDVVVADDGHKALEMLREEPVELVLLGANMAQILETLKSDSKLREIPVIVVADPEDIDRLVRCIRMGADDYLLRPFEPVLLRARINTTLEKNQVNEQLADYLQRFIREKRRADDLSHVVVPTGIALSGERDFDRLLEKIVLQTMSFCNADAGTLYLRNKEDYLEFVVVRNNLLYIKMGGASGEEVTFPPLPMYHPETGEPNHKNIVTHVALTGKSVNIPDAYKVEDFDFSGTKAFDSETGYRSTSVLTIPLRNSKNYVVGVLQLINALGRELGHIIPFTGHQEEMVQAMSLLAVIAIESFAREQQLKLEIKKLRAGTDE